MTDRLLPFVTVNDSAVTVDDALRHGLLDGGAKGLLSQLIDRELLRQYAAAQAITVSDSELQAAVDEMRRDRGLENADRTMEWVRAHGQTLESLQRAIEDLLLRNKIMSGIPQSEIEHRYETTRADLESVTLFSIRAETEAEAAALRRRIESGEQFSAIAASASRDASTRPLGGYVVRLRRSDLSPEIAEAVFAARPGTIIGPLRTEKGYNLFLVASRHDPSIEEEQAGIRLLLFEELLTQLRQSAVVRYPPLAHS